MPGCGDSHVTSRKWEMRAKKCKPVEKGGGEMSSFTFSRVLHQYRSIPAHPLGIHTCVGSLCLTIPTLWWSQSVVDSFARPREGRDSCRDEPGITKQKRDETAPADPVSLIALAVASAFPLIHGAILGVLYSSTCSAPCVLNLYAASRRVSLQGPHMWLRDHSGTAMVKDKPLARRIASYG